MVRVLLGGGLMGLANLVPGISGGTMLLVAGVYTRFVDAVAEVTTLKFRGATLRFLGIVGLSAVVTIALLAGLIESLVASHQWIMYSLFVGLTLGGVPVLWRMARKPSRAFLGGALAGLVFMVWLALVGTGGGEGTGILFLAGVAGASAMILPGVSGAYLLIILGQYRVILRAVDQCKEGIKGDFGLFRDAMGVVIPVGVGVLIGVVVVSHLVRWMLDKYQAGTLGVLMGLVLGSVIGVYPFQEAREVRDAPRVYFTPSMRQVAIAVGLLVLGYALTRLIDRVGNPADKPADRPA